jgi:hypothetical protein
MPRHEFRHDNGYHCEDSESSEAVDGAFCHGPVGCLVLNIQMTSARVSWQAATAEPAALWPLLCVLRGIGFSCYSLPVCFGQEVVITSSEAS